MSDRLDMRQLVDALGERGVPATVEHMGGGVAAVVVGDVVAIDEWGSDRHAAIVGVGSCGPGLRRYAYWDYITLGPDTDDWWLAEQWRGPRDVDALAHYLLGRLEEFRSHVQETLGDVLSACAECGRNVTNVCVECNVSAERAGAS